MPLKTIFYIFESIYIMSRSGVMGFTLIELLIVISILAILAIGILAAIDPIEQFRRGSDTTIIRTAAEYKKGIERYYTTRSGNYPTSLSSGYTGSLVIGGVGYSSVLDLIIAGEVRSTFPTGNVPLSSVIVTMPSGGLMTVCTFLNSKSFKGNTNALYSTAGTVSAAMNCPTTTSQCSICYF